MCGIIGIVSRQSVTSHLLDGLQNLEYRGYDSMGIATLVDGHIERRRAEGKLVQLRQLIDSDPIKGNIGIGHTRWATHGAPIERNAHPHMSHRVVVVHNGIIENFLEIKAHLMGLGHVFHSDTDTEVIVHFLTEELEQGRSPLEAVRACLDLVKGAFALAILFKDYESMMIAARRGSPLAIGYGEQEMSLGSDAIALAALTNRISYLEDGDYAVLSDSTVTVYNQEHQEVERPIITQNSVSMDHLGKGTYKHFMLKEIFQQPTVMGDALTAYINEQGTIHFPGLESLDWTSIQQVTIVACGTSYYAGMVARYWFESLAHLPITVEIASEFRYRDVPRHSHEVVIFISQSGETVDSLCALQQITSPSIAIVNVPHSSISRQATYTLLTHAGPEIGVASTKAFTAQLTVLALLALKAGHVRGALSREETQELLNHMKKAPEMLSQALRGDEDIQRMAYALKDVQHALYLGRGTSFPMAMEGALKLKELSYIHAEGYAAGEMKHGPIALIDESMPVIVLAPRDRWLEKTLSNVQEVLARGARVICLTDDEGAQALFQHSQKIQVLILPTVHSFVTPFIYAIPLQLLAYHAALVKGTDVDQPRNLAKSVTVE